MLQNFKIIHDMSFFYYFSVEASFEEDVRRYLARKPMTTTEILRKVPFIYYVSTRIAQNLIWISNFSQTLQVFSSKQKKIFFNITFWRNFHAVVWNF